MPSAEYRIESNQPIAGRFWPAKGSQQYSLSDRELAISIAAKSFSEPDSDIRVVHVPTGEIVYTKPAPRRSDEWQEEP